MGTTAPQIAPGECSHNAVLTDGQNIKCLQCGLVRKAERETYQALVFGGMKIINADQRARAMTCYQRCIEAFALCTDTNAAAALRDAALLLDELAK